MISKYIRGMVYYANIPSVIYAPSVQSGRRPVVIISNDVANVFSQNVTVVPCTTNISKKDSQPTHFTTKLARDVESVVLCENIMTIDKSYLETFMGVLDDYTMKGITDALAVALGFTNLKLGSPASELGGDTLKADTEEKPTKTQEEMAEEDKPITLSSKIDRTIKTNEFMQRFIKEMKQHGARYVAKKYGLSTEHAAYQRALRYRKALDTK